MKIISELPFWPTESGQKVLINKLTSAGVVLALSETLESVSSFVVVVVSNSSEALQFERELHFYLKDKGIPIVHFPDWETLPYDNFSPHQDIISERLTSLYRLPLIKRGILIIPIATLMQRIIPKSYLQQHALVLGKGDPLDLSAMRLHLEEAGYRLVHQVMEHGEFSVRGSLLDIFPMGNQMPFRIDLFGNEVDSIRTFDPDTQRSDIVLESIRILPAREVPLSEEGIQYFRSRWRQRFEGTPRNCSIYSELSEHRVPPGIEYFIPLFFEKTSTLFDYIPKESVFLLIGDLHKEADIFWKEINARFDQYGHDLERPILRPNELYLPTQDVFSEIKLFAQWVLKNTSNIAIESSPILPLPDIASLPKESNPLKKLELFLSGFKGRVLFCAETTGRREFLKGFLNTIQVKPVEIETWSEFLEADIPYCLTVATVFEGWYLSDQTIAVIPEAALFGRQVLQRRRRKRVEIEKDASIRSIAELRPGMPVVHLEHGVGRYLGLTRLAFQDQIGEFVSLEYAGGDKLHVSVASLQLLSRYGGGAFVENAPLNRLGTEQWKRIKQKAIEQIKDVAAELLDVYTRREAKVGYAFPSPSEGYWKFASEFPFEETPDQTEAIKKVIEDMCAKRPMDRIICGDVGFGKTEVAMRAAFIAIDAGKQVAVLVPTTLLAEQHYQTFLDRFSDTAARIQVLSRFRSKKETDSILKALKEGTIDILIGTHKLLMEEVLFKNLGLLVIDEEHRFGVSQKERIKSLRSEVDILTLTATPIPRTLNMSLSGLRDLSIISTPPSKRLSIKTFVREYSFPLIEEAILRELRRGGQIYYLHNEVVSIESKALKLQEKLPNARVAIAHGQMREKDLEKIMSEFYHGHYHILVCTTIIETGIDIPNANTIIIERADKFGLAQLHQLRGRVGRSHHQAYAYCLTPNPKAMTLDAKKRLEALEMHEELGAGFLLATQDLEIRGAGELLGEEQSGNIQSIGFSLYMEILDQSVEALKKGDPILLEKSLSQGVEVDLNVSALIPDTYLPDVQIRLLLYKKIAHARNQEMLNELKVEMIDRFGVYPEPTQHLFRITYIRLQCQLLGIQKIQVNRKGGKIEFTSKPSVDPLVIIQLIQNNPNCYRFVGSEVLQFESSLTEIEERFSFVESLLNFFQGKTKTLVKPSGGTQ